MPRKVSENITEISLKKFDPQSIPVGKTLMVCAKRGSGKSVLIRDIMYHMRHKIPFGIAISATEEGNGAYGEMMPQSFIYDDYSPELIEKFVNRQKYMVQNKKKHPEAFLIMDDMMADGKKIMKDVNIRFIYLNGRHYKITMITAAQYSVESGSPCIRSNLDYVFVLRENVVANQEKLWRNFFGIFPTFKMFQQTLMACTEDYGMLVLDQTSKSNKIEDCVFWYKAKVHGKFRLCSPAVWKLDKQIYNKNANSVGLSSITGPQISTAQKGRQADKNTTFTVKKKK